MPRMSISPSEGETTTLRLRASNRAEPEPLDRRRLGRHRSVGGAQDDRRQAAIGLDRGEPRRPFRERGDRRAAVDQHPPLDAVDRHQRPEMAVGRHRDADLAPGHLLLVEAEKARNPGEIGIVGRLLEQKEDREGDQGEREQRAQEPADIGNAEQQEEHQSGRERVERQLLPFEIGGDRHFAYLGMPAPTFDPCSRGSGPKRFGPRVPSPTSSTISTSRVSQ